MPLNGRLRKTSPWLKVSPRVKFPRLRVDIANRFLKSGDQGYAFYSYERLTGTTGESLRTFSFVGVRPHRMEHMPVAQAIESHALHIDPSALGSGGVNFVAPP